MGQKDRIIENLLKKYLEKDQNSNSGEMIHTRGRQRGGVLRLSVAPEDVIIVKLWRIRSLKERIKSVMYLNNGYREWEMHQFLFDNGLQVPAPLGFYKIHLKDNEYWEAMAIEDLGNTEVSLDYLKMLISEKKETFVEAFELELIRMTIDLLDLNVIDIDNQLNNFLVDSNSKLYRIDFECARRVKGQVWRAKEYLTMIARMLTSHVHAVQPDVDRSIKFAERLYERINVDSTMKIKIGEMVNKSLERQYLEIGIDSRLVLPGC